MTPRRPVNSASGGELSRPNNRRRFAADFFLAHRLGRVGVDLLWSPTVVVVAAVSLGTVLGFLAAGILGAVSALGAAALCGLAVDRVGAAQEKKRQDGLLPEIALRLGRAVRAGAPTEVALNNVGAELTHAHPQLRVVHGELRSGRPLADTIESWQRRAEGDAEQLLAVALGMGASGGGELAAALDRVGDGLRDVVALDRRRRVVLAQTQLSAGVLVALPIVFAIVASALHGGLIYEGLSGLALLAGGLGLDGLGVVWMRRLIGRLR